MRVVALVVILLAAHRQPTPPAWEKNWQHGMDLYKQSRWTEAVPFFEQVIRQLPDGFSGYSMAGKCRMNAGLYEEALSDLKKALSLKPGDGETFVRVLTVLWSLKRPAEILQAVRVRPSDGLDPDYRGDVFRLAGLAALNANDQAASPAYFRQSEAAYAEVSGRVEDATFRERRAETLSWLVRLLNQQARTAPKEERAVLYAESNALASTLLALNAGFESLLSAAEAALGSQHYDAAADLAGKAAAADPRSGFARLYLGQARSNLGRYMDAVTPLEEAARLLPQNNRRTAYNQLGFVLEKLGQTGRALEAYRRAGNTERVRKMQDIPAPAVPVQP